MTILITGGNGFIGTALIDAFLIEGLSFRVALRRDCFRWPNLDCVEVGEINAETDWSNALLGVSQIVHLASRVHVLDDRSLDPLSEYRKINTFGTRRLVEQAVEMGVNRFIYLSSIKVNGEHTFPGEVFKPDDDFLTNDPYGISKYEAEQELLSLADESGMEVVIIRPPLVYGPNVKANFATMIKWIKKEVPLPFGSINNKRSLIAIDNLVNFILLCSDKNRSPNAANQVFLISDGEDVSTTSLLKKVANAYGVKPLLFPVPVSFMRFVAKLLGKSDMADRLFGDLQVDSSKARELLGWKPVVTIDEQLRKMAVLDKNSGKQ